MASSLDDIKKLRTRTGAGMADCKKALDEAEGDMDAAIEILRKKGAATAAKRADKSANEGVIAMAVADDHKNGVIVEINCETDFVAMNVEFSTFAEKLAQVALGSSATSIEGLMSELVDGETVQAHLNELLAKFSERIEISRFDKVESPEGFVTVYIHGGSKLGVLVELTGSGSVDETDLVARNVAMQVAAMNPAYVRREDVPQDVLDKEKEIYAENAANMGKPPEIAAKIAENRVEKFYEEACLLEQSFVKDSSKTVSDILAEFSKNAGKEVTVRQFIRYNLGDAVAEPVGE